MPFIIRLQSAYDNHKKRITIVLKWIVLLATGLYLLKIFVDFSANQNFISYISANFSKNGLWLILVLLLLPVNWFFEARKWQKIVSPTEKISLRRSILSVLAGSSTAFFSPNRTGDFVGRGLYLKKENQTQVIPFSVLNSLTQNIILIACGFPMAVLFLLSTQNQEISGYGFLLKSGGILLAGTIGFFIIFRIIRKINLPEWLLRMKLTFLKTGSKTFFEVLYFSFLRYLIFSVQFYFMLRFFGVDLSVWQAIIALPTNYLLVTLAPAFSFSEAGVRGSTAVLVIGAFSSQLTGIALAGMTIWLVNFVIPMMVGSVLILLKEPNNMTALPFTDSGDAST